MQEQLDFEREKIAEKRKRKKEKKSGEAGEAPAAAQRRGEEETAATARIAEEERQRQKPTRGMISLGRITGWSPVTKDFFGNGVPTGYEPVSGGWRPHFIPPKKVDETLLQ